MTQNVNKIKTKQGVIKKIQLTPRGALHNEKIYGTKKRPIITMAKVGAALDEATINKISNLTIREALLKRLAEYNGDAKKAFAGKNSLEKNPIYLNEEKTKVLPALVKTVEWETYHPIRKPITPDLKIEKVIDKGIRKILKVRLAKFNGDAKKAFSNLDENPIYIDEAKKIALKRVSIEGVLSAIPLHTLKDQAGKPIKNKNDKEVYGDYIETKNNHHVAIFRDKNGNLQENVVTFFDTVKRKLKNKPTVNKSLNKDNGWLFLFTMKENEYFVFPNETTSFKPLEIDLMDEKNNALISPNLFRVQSISKGDYYFRHHLESMNIKDIKLKNLTFKRIRSLSELKGIVKVRINAIGRIVAIGEYD
nr:hypothetical protein [Prevotella aurantiaca]